MTNDFLLQLVSDLKQLRQDASALSPFPECKCCGECCKQMVLVSGLEALALVGSPVVNSGTGCPFLGQDNKCSVHEHRPIVCRTYGPRRKLYESFGPADELHVFNAGICKYGKEEITAENLPQDLVSKLIAFYDLTETVMLSVGPDPEMRKTPFVSRIMTPVNGVAMLQPSEYFSPERTKELAEEIRKIKEAQCPTQD